MRSFRTIINIFASSLNTVAFASAAQNDSFRYVNLFFAVTCGLFVIVLSNQENF